eukprot:CAMPEP_0170734212 /NCGR_PEP_ID=MMETSP0437-20130122/2475_1 /TAXON_ID=0 /ORGANISM="Sexangularia sp." /LENGTH=209 /DNA_ID=CAMNT_0011072521 /DNA_START=13 /DNA_END=642 /DNA_ORIENTATION=+
MAVLLFLLSILPSFLCADSDTVTISYFRCEVQNEISVAQGGDADAWNTSLTTCANRLADATDSTYQSETISQTGRKRLELPGLTGAPDLDDELTPVSFYFQAGKDEVCIKWTQGVRTCCEQGDSACELDTVEELECYSTSETTGLCTEAEQAKTRYTLLKNICDPVDGRSATPDTHLMTWTLACGLAATMSLSSAVLSLIAMAALALAA